MKKFITRILISFAIFWSAILPIYLIEPIHEGKDISIYSGPAEIYMYVIMTIFLVSWIILSDTIARWIIRKASKLNTSQILFQDLLEIAIKYKFEISVPKEETDIDKLTILFQDGEFIFHAVDKGRDVKKE